MSLASLTYGLERPSLRHDIALWGSAALFVLAVHGGGGWYLSRSLEISAEPPAAQEAMVVDLSPVMQSTPEQVEVETQSEEEPTEMAAAEEPVEAEQPEEATEVQPEMTEPVVEEIVPEEMVEEETPVEPEEIEPEIAEPEPQVVTEEVMPEEPTVALPDSDVPMPVSRPEPPREVVQEERPRPRPRREQPRREEPRREEPRPTREARPQPRSEASTEQRASSAPRVSPARWNSQAASRVQRAAQRAISRIQGTGTVGISFRVSASGGVSGVRVSSSSGNPAIDSAVVRAVSGISLPPPPSGATSVTIPVYKSR